MRKNVGTIDATVRITLGFLGLAYGIGRMSRRPYRAPWLLMALSAMKIAEGMTRFCPMLYAMRANTLKGNGMKGVWGQIREAGKFVAGATGTRRTAGHESNSAAQPTSPSDLQLEHAIKDYVTEQTGSTPPGAGQPSAETSSMDERSYSHSS
ncbi:DUF2892 domain-containing protein [Brevibacillus sp. SYP-B805]|uniref:YgaP family membrane protein n=1 Tax=Brevibacillus sp. SYP-B805 TaxID=1578199 RepID=UPI0013EA5E6D|nr:DUF2892 domain-containing protein [Brevibacillus sp. SYP-B805]NGQ97020.1 DUF2892 domain-containing protein [Brevibacillus sp. SYP-B805]